MPTPPTPPFPPGALTPQRNAHGHYHLRTPGARVCTLYGNNDAHTLAVADMACDYPRLAAERDRYKLALERIAAAWPSGDLAANNGDRRELARQALYGADREAVDAAQIAAALRDIESRGTTCEALDRAWEGGGM